MANYATAEYMKLLGVESKSRVVLASPIGKPDSVGIAESPTAAQPIGAKQPSNLTTALIQNELVSFPTVEHTFNALVAEWRRLRGFGSSTAPLVNDAYGQIATMGQPVVPLLLREVAKGSGHWFDVLTWLTRVDLATPETRGNIRALRAAWIKWGADNGYLPREYLPRSLVQGPSPATQ